MIRRTEILLAALLIPALAAADTRYSGEFDYKTFESSKSYFAGRSTAQIDHLCKTGEHASTEDLEQCEHRDFERAQAQLDTQLSVLKSLVDKADKFLVEYDEKPLSLPYFSKSRDGWNQYRDNECYTEAYMMGGASEKYIRFWDCMASLTNAHIKDVKQTINDWNNP